MSSVDRLLYGLIRPWLFGLDPHRGQAVAMAMLRMRNVFARDALAGGGSDVTPGTPKGATAMGVELMGLRFPNRVGLAAGFDKNAYDVDSLGRLGFGFIEVGTVTPRPQPGNPRPNLFRLVPDEALINRLGFNNEGAAAVVRRLEVRRYAGICGVNIGKNFDTPLESSVNDYASCLRTVYAVADYVTINVSSPNTPGLRGLQDPGALRPLLLELANLREQLAPVHSKRVPLLVKLSPDLSDEQVLEVARELRELPVDAIVATNTTTTRPGPLKSAAAVETGGLSGRPLHSRSVAVLRSLRATMGPGFPIIGVGGIVSPEAGMATRDAGADLLQLYTGLIYRGPALIRELLDIVRSSSHEHQR
ncbi:MAG TPA: quinone-dependent dihydroorotate dehydrogenase [Steroidobacteraceae bacterium]|nr:quinone-dependent dihydroorotate dehydrogenase [Steroidobacteraceae bacterium]